MPTPFAGELFTFSNPDGSEVTVRGWGNQFDAIFETLDGYTVVQEPSTGYYHYAMLDESRAGLIPAETRVGQADPAALGIPRHIRLPRAVSRARAEASRSSYLDALGAEPRWQQRRAAIKESRRSSEARGANPAPPPAGTTGDYVGLLLLVQFPDVPGDIDRDEIDRYCNEVGYSGFGNKGSVFDYFLDVSDRKLRYTMVVAPYYTAKKPRSYYTDEAVQNGVRAQELIKEALDALSRTDFDFTQLTTDSDGFVYALNVFYAGRRVNNWSKGLWPHSWALAQPYQAQAGITFSDYQITDLGVQLALRTFCHENGHMICDFPDLYDYDSDSVGFGIGNYSLMCFGGSDKNPTQVDAYLKHAAGWTSRITTLKPGMTETVTAGRNEFLVHRKNNSEYFLIENRQQKGRDATLPDSGLAIWHVDELGNNSFEEMLPHRHYECSLEQADNRFDLERRVNGGDVEDLFGGDGSAFGRNTSPNSRWWNGTPSGLEIESISPPGDTITVRTRSAVVPLLLPLLDNLRRFGRDGIERLQGAVGRRQ